MIIEILKPQIATRFLNDEKYRSGHIRIINPLPLRKIMGLHVPEMKSVARKLAIKENVAQILDEFEATHKSNPFDLVHEEIVVWGLIISMMKASVDERWRRFDAFVPAIDNWAVCDTVCSSAKWCKKISLEELWRNLKPFYTSRREFEVRFGLVMSMCYLLTSPDSTKMVFQELEQIALDSIATDYNFNNPPYYVKMAVAWLMATALAKYPEETREFATHSHLPEDVKHLYARKARESLRTRTVAPFL